MLDEAVKKPLYGNQDCVYGGTLGKGPKASTRHKGNVLWILPASPNMEDLGSP